MRQIRRAQTGCLLALVCFSAFLACVSYPYRAWQYGAGLGVIALASVFIRVGWIVPCTIAGPYIGVFVLNSPIHGGTIESQMYETVTGLVVGTVGGLLIGAILDATRPDEARRRG